MMANILGMSVGADSGGGSGRRVAGPELINLLNNSTSVNNNRNGETPADRVTGESNFFRIHGPFSPHVSQSQGNGSSQSVSSSNIPVDIMRFPDRYVIYADVPGMVAGPHSLEITVQGSMLVISGTRHSPSSSSHPDMVCMQERPQGAVQRNIFLHRDADLNAITASLVDGVLCIHVGRMMYTPARTGVPVHIMHHLQPEHSRGRTRNRYRNRNNGQTQGQQAR